MRADLCKRKFLGQLCALLHLKEKKRYSNLLLCLDYLNNKLVLLRADDLRDDFNVC